MADEPEDDILELTQDDQIEGAEPVEPQDDDLSLEIEGEETGDETPVVRQLRQRLRDSERELHETRKSAMPQQQVEVGKKPDLWEDCEGDTDKYDAALEAWHGRKNAADQARRREQEQEQVRNQQFERARGKYQASAASLKIKGGIEPAERAVVETLGPDYLGAIIQYADDPAKLVGALGGNQAALLKIAAESDPMLRFKMMLKMEGKIVAKRTAPPPPETDTIQRGTAAVSRLAVDKKLADLEAKAEKTGDRTELIRYKSQQRKEARA